MSGVALTIRSPSSSRISRSVVWVAGCCGPKLSVQVACLGSVLELGFVEQVAASAHLRHPWCHRSGFRVAAVTIRPAESRGKLCRSPRPRSGIVFAERDRR